MARGWRRRAGRWVGPTVLVLLVMGAGVVSGCGSCESRRVNCRERCEDRYRSSIAAREQCYQKCFWEYRQCED